MCTLGPMRSIELDPENRRLVLSFPYHPRLVEVVRSLPERRFDPVAKTWSVPCDHAAEVVAVLQDHGFVRTPEVEELLDGSALAGAGLADNVEGPPTLRISQINARVRGAIAAAFPEAFWVVGEIAGYERNEHKRHVYFELVEKEEGAEKPRARVTAVLFEKVQPRIRRKLEGAEDPFALRDGIEVRFRVRADLYEPSGSYQLILEDVDPVHTLGKLALARQQILKVLTERGLRDRNHSRPLPELPLEVAVITSWGSDAYNDLLKELEQSGYAFHLTVYDARMQGRELKRTVAAGLAYFARHAGDHDVLVLARGGGSRTDLVWFDDLDLAVAVAEHPLKVVCGIGHERDRGVLDCITTSVKTPTAAAQVLVKQVAGAVEVLDARLERVILGARHHCLEETDRLRRLGLRICTTTGMRIQAARHVVDQRARLVVQAVQAGLRAARIAVVNRTDRLRTAAGVATRMSTARVEAAGRALDPHRLAALVHQARRHVEALESRLRALDPVQVLKRGFAVVRDQEGRIVTGIARLRPDDTIDVELRDGRAGARVQAVRPATRESQTSTKGNPKR